MKEKRVMNLVIEGQKSRQGMNTFCDKIFTEIRMEREIKEIKIKASRTNTLTRK